VLGTIDPTVLVRPPAGLRLPPDALVTDAGRLLERQPRQGGEPSSHCDGHTESITTLTAAGRDPVIRSRYSSTRRWTSRPSSGNRAPQSTSRCSSTAHIPSSPLI